MKPENKYIAKGGDELVGEIVKDLRIKRGMTQAELTAAIGKTQQNVSYIESGKISINHKMILKLCEVLKVAPSFFMPSNTRKTCKE